MDAAFRAEFWMPFFWGLAMIISWIGWGTLVQRVLRVNRGMGVDWALRAGWGMAVLLAIGGVTSVLAMTSAELLLGYSVIGIVAAAWDFYRSMKKPQLRGHLLTSWRWDCWVWLLPVVALLALSYLGSIESDSANFWDDPPAYMVFTKRLLQTGTIIEPYSLRRLATYGGQQLLQAQQSLYAGDLNLGLLDWGIGPILIAGVLWGQMRPRTNRQRMRAALLVLLVLLVPLPRINSQSAATGLFMFVVLAGTLRLVRPGRRDRWRMVVWSGLVAAAVGTLRINYVPVAVVYVAAAGVGRTMQERGRWRICTGETGVALGVMVVGLLPWALMLYISSNTLLFPLMKGNLQPDYAFLAGPMTVGQKAAWVGSYYWHVDAILQLVPVLFVLGWRHWRDRLPLYGAGIAMTIAAVVAYAHSDFGNLYRYTYPSMMAAVVVAMAYVVRRARSRLALVVVYGTVTAMICSELEYTVGNLQNYWAMTMGAFTRPRIFASPALVQNYQAAQEAVPAGEKIFAAVSFANLLDYRRNPIYNIDTPGAAGPGPGLPVREGPEALKAYLKGQGFRYMILVHPDDDLTIYSRARWTALGTQLKTANDAERVAWPFTMAYIRDVMSLLQTEDVVYAKGSLRVIRFR